MYSSTSSCDFAKGTFCSPCKLNIPFSVDAMSTSWVDWLIFYSGTLSKSVKNVKTLLPCFRDFLKIKTFS